MITKPLSYCRSFLVLAAFCSAPAIAHAESPQQIPSPVSKIFIPDGFDDNDNAEVILQGMFPSTCYKVGSTSVAVDSAAKVIDISATSYRYDGESRCNEVDVPFIQRVKLGVLSRGDYNVVVKNAPSVTGVLPIAARLTEAPEDYYYAPVSSVVVSRDLESSKPKVVLEGHYPFLKRGCMILTEVRTHFAPGDVLVVLPITEIREGEACNDVPVSRTFHVEKAIDMPLDRPALVHVRVLNGDSVNQLIPERS